MPTLLPTPSPPANEPTAGASVTAVPSAYPVPPTIESLPYPPPETEVSSTPRPTTLDNTDDQTYLPVVVDQEPPPTPIPPTKVIPPTPTPIIPIDFQAIRTQLQLEGLELAYSKIGFHVGVGGTSRGLEDYMRLLDANGVPFFLKSVDGAGQILIAQELMRQSGVPHTLVYRKSAGGDHYNVPPYDLPPEEAARVHWQLHLDAFPPELDPSMVWLETVNEVDKTRSEWLAQFSLATAQMALRDGYNWAAFGWSSGEPEPSDWQSPAMLEFLRLAGANPDRIAIALHEYSYVLDDIAHEYPYKVGRFQELFRICDQYGIPRPTILITEWGWEYEDVPQTAQAIRDIEWAARLYAPYPQVKGAAIWFLGSGFGNIARQTERLIMPVAAFSVQHYFTMPQPPNLAPIAPEQFRP